MLNMSYGCCCCWGIRETSAGKFENVVPPGCLCIAFPIQRLIGVVSLRIEQLEVRCETKTKDNVFVRVVVAIQYRVSPDKVPTAYYKFHDPQHQIRSYVYDVIRSCIPRMELDETYESKADVADSVKKQLAAVMNEYGFEIVDALVTDIDPNAYVKAAMNEINGTNKAMLLLLLISTASMRTRYAAAEKAEAEKIMLVKASEAEAESKYLTGLGVARQRKAIVEGMRTSVAELEGHVSGVSALEAMELLQLTQYFDMIRDVGTVVRGNNAQSTIFLPHGPESLRKLRECLNAAK